ncbi:hypothetical protein MAR_035810 [Mya arenaria]|uniref:Uncharacterized protein n=1 Tax=Mya arenaria TaxID=6604 RepID=A0ABY7EP58_MYAAR|nr:hypothetical protein MAR_035810 [Mya arenaria]
MTSDAYWQNVVQTKRQMSFAVKKPMMWIAIDTTIGMLTASVMSKRQVVDSIKPLEREHYATKRQAVLTDLEGQYAKMFNTESLNRKSHEKCLQRCCSSFYAKTCKTYRNEKGCCWTDFILLFPAFIIIICNLFWSKDCF